ncbi:HlyD family secretion protein [Desulfobulbus rhabdoformis]|uniref:HlyD family secretion protein n=1 Tax=Desulfobulbus rhabdoformis TaxID=34032 RepID=UPI001F06BB6E|nr:HlyD family efflux transporter periplasmic adaptor subunit [Desulfobulbus rhabdoformis]
MKKHGSVLFWVVLTVIFVGAAASIWIYAGRDDGEEFLASGNGRIEAVEIDIAAKSAGRIEEILVDEGDFVTSGQVLARMDTSILDAQRKEAEALLRQAENAIETARYQVAQRLSEKDAAMATVAQRQAKMELAKKRLARSESLADKRAISVQRVEDDRSDYLEAQALLHASKAEVKAVEAAIATARSQVIGAESNVEAVHATLLRIKANIDDAVLKAARTGRVQYRVAQAGEVIAAGGHVLNMIDLADIYMTFFLPTRAAGQIAIGTEVRLVLDPAPQYVIPAHISYVSDVAQFTPKTVETAIERQKLMFRVKAQVAPELVKKYIWL